MRRHNLYSPLSKNDCRHASIDRLDKDTGMSRGTVTVNLFGIDGIKLHYYIYLCSVIHMCHYLMDNGMERNGYEEETKDLYLTIY